MTDVGVRTHYEVLGVEPGCTFEELRTAYRRRAREHHPDVVDPSAPGTARGRRVSMADINEAWRILSDGVRRSRYDRSIPLVEWAPVAMPQPAPEAGRSRRLAWAASVQGQIAKLALLAGRSATQALLIRQPRAPRSEYERLVTRLVEGLCEDTESRVRSARAAGADPLDLAVSATLVGIRTLADRTRRDATTGLTPELLMVAELLDRMWDVLAHELPVQLTSALGGNPQVARALTRHINRSA
jgi:hypothetical protein